MIRKLICSMPKWIGGGHKKGKRVAGTDTVKCSRCEATWIRKATSRAPA